MHALRLEKGIDQNLLAEKLELSNARISYRETGKQEPDAAATFKLAQYFDVSADRLLDITDD